MSPAPRDAQCDTVKVTVVACICLGIIAALWLPPADAEAHQVTRSDVRERVAAWREHRAAAGRPVTHAQWRREIARWSERARAHNRRHRAEPIRRCDRTSGMPRSVCAGLVAAGRRKGRVGWATDPALHELLRRESTWNPRAVNPSSGACGLWQFVPCRWETLPSVETQSVAGFRYIRSRYGSPAAALAHHNRRGWY